MNHCGYIRFFETNEYSFSGEDSIMEEKDIGICASIASILTPPSRVGTMECFQGCPYTNTAFRFDLRLDGEPLECDEWTWLPNAMLRHGSFKTFSIETITAVIPASRTAVMKATVKNLTDQALTIRHMMKQKTRPITCHVLVLFFLGYFFIL